MEFEVIEKEAMKSPVMSDNVIGISEELYFLMFRNIYTAFREGTIDQEQASKEKLKARTVCQKKEDLLKLYTRIGAEQYENSNKSEALRAAINKAKTKEEKGKLALECVYALTGDKMILKEAEAM